MSLEQNSDTDRLRVQSCDRTIEHNEKDGEIERVKLKVRRKISQYQNKAYFFEGQLNPISLQNKSLKEQLIGIKKIMLASTDLLRNLLPIENSPQRKLKIQMAGIEQISKMIQEDWVLMQDQIYREKKVILLHQATIQRLQARYSSTVEEYDEKISQMAFAFREREEKLCQNVQELKSQIQQTKRKAQEENEKIIKQFQDKITAAKKLQKDFRLYQKQMGERCSNYERAAQRLKEEIASNLQQFQKSKEHLKEIYDKLMTEKLQEQKDTYEFMINLKEEEKIKLMNDIQTQASEFKKKFSQKNSQINYLSGLNDQLKEEIGVCKNEVWEHKLKLDESNKNIKNLQDQMYKERQTFRSNEKKFEQEMRKMEKKYQQMNLKIKLKEKELKDFTQKSEQEAKRLSEQKQKLNQKLEQNQKNLAESKRRLREFDQKFKETLENQRNKYNQMVQKFQEGEKILQGILNKAQSQIEQRKAQVLQMAKQHQQQLTKERQRSEQKEQKLLREQEMRFNQMMNDHNERVKHLTQNYERMMKQAQIANNQYVRNLTQQHNNKLNEHEKKLQQFKEMSQNQLRTLKQNLGQQMAQNRRLQDIWRETSQKLEQERLSAAEKLQFEKQKILSQMKEQIDNFKKILSDQKAQYQKRFDEMQDQMSKQINMLKKNNAMEEVEDKYNNIINMLKAEMQEQRKKLEKEKQEAVQNSKSFYENQIEKLKSSYHEELNLLSKKLEFDISKLNDQLLNEKEAHQFAKLSREQKIQFLLHRIQNYKNDMMERDHEILELQFTIQKKNKEIEQIDSIVAERIREKMLEKDEEIKRIREDCLKEISKKESEFRVKVREIEAERMRFTQQIYDQFQQIKNRHYFEQEKLLTKYNQLQKLFQERPSRAEDLSKIKQLIEQKSKMDLQIKQCKKKVKEANEIVKYLNLQLENYKVTYDIFGPGGQNISPEKKQPNENALRSALLSSRKETTPLLSEDGDRAHSYLKNNNRGQRRIMTEGEESPDIRVFPSIYKNNSSMVLEENEEDQQNSVIFVNEEIQKEKPKIKKNHTQIQIEDKSEELRSYAGMFLSLLSSEAPPVAIQARRNPEGYKRRRNIIRKRSINQHEKKLQVRDKTITLPQ